MKVFKLRPVFGRFGADPENAARFRQEQLEPVLASGESVTLDFEGIAGINSSFANTLFANLVHRLSPAVMEHVRLENCRPGIQSLVQLATGIGNDRYSVSSLPVAR
jgi:hypothetical protein